MSYSEILAERVSQGLGKSRKVETKRMMGGLVFMVNVKMCVCVMGDDLMVRIDPEARSAALQRKGCREKGLMKRPMKAFVFVGPSGTKSDKDLESWLEMALEYNKRVKPGKKQQAGKRLS
jgi:TfoX/Sxy family transcriptional regulator of competence genes